MMEFKKIFGWIIFFMGLTIMLYGIYASFNIFTTRDTAPQLFVSEQVEQTNGISLPLTGKIPSSEDMQIQMQEIMGEQIGEQMKSILPSDFLPLLFNLMAWSIFAGISIFGGAQIAGLGIKLLK